jgi:hypothetical protein
VPHRFGAARIRADPGMSAPTMYSRFLLMVYTEGVAEPETVLVESHPPRTWANARDTLMRRHYMKPEGAGRRGVTGGWMLSVATDDTRGTPRVYLDARSMM